MTAPYSLYSRPPYDFRELNRINEMMANEQPERTIQITWLRFTKERRTRDGSYRDRLDGRCRLPAHQFADQSVLPAALFRQYGGIFRFRPHRIVAAGRH